MARSSPLTGKRILAVDDERDVLALLAEELTMCELVSKASYEEAAAYLAGHQPDLAILDIMGVNGFELLRLCAEKGIPAVMLTAHAFTLDSLKRSIDMGAKAYFPKERIHELAPFLEEVFSSDRKETWQRLSDRVGELFNATFGSDWKKHLVDVGPFIVPR